MDGFEIFSLVWLILMAGRLIVAIFIPKLRGRIKKGVPSSVVTEILWFLAFGSPFLWILLNNINKYKPFSFCVPVFP